MPGAGLTQRPSLGTSCLWATSSGPAPLLSRLQGPDTGWERAGTGVLRELGLAVLLLFMEVKEGSLDLRGWSCPGPPPLSCVCRPCPLNNSTRGGREGQGPAAGSPWPRNAKAQLAGRGLRRAVGPALSVCSPGWSPVLAQGHLLSVTGSSGRPLLRPRVVIRWADHFKKERPMVFVPAAKLWAAL